MNLVYGRLMEEFEFGKLKVNSNIDFVTFFTKNVKRKNGGKKTARENRKNIVIQQCK